LNIPSTLNKCQLMILALTASLEEQTAINTLLEGEIKQTAIGERAADQEVTRLQHELRTIDGRWHRRFREQANQWDIRTIEIKRQLSYMVNLSVESKSFAPPPIIVKCGKSEVFDEKPPMISIGCTWPVGNCECMNGDQEED
jgi:hypothetical protein